MMMTTTLRRRRKKRKDCLDATSDDVDVETSELFEMKYVVDYYRYCSVTVHQGRDGHRIALFEQNTKRGNTASYGIAELMEGPEGPPWHAERAAPVSASYRLFLIICSSTIPFAVLFCEMII
jgi:hypothetical protein